jgi:putative transposase
MARPLRIEYPDAWYHVMNRGRQREEIFADSQDFNVFLKLLEESTLLWGGRISAYCLMSNHYHLLIQTPRANLSRAMRHIDGIYTQRFNRRHKAVGQLFAGRYRSILIDADAYLLQVVRYIHRNPLRAGMAARPDKYPWTSHPGYLSDEKRWDWLHKEYVLSHFSTEPHARRQAYKEFIADDDSEEIRRFFGEKNVRAILGSDKFTKWVRDHFSNQAADEEVPESKLLLPEIEEVADAVCAVYGVDRNILLVSKRRTTNEPRNMAIYLSRRLCGATLREIRDRFNFHSDSSVGSAIERMTALESKNSKVRTSIGLVKEQLNKR